MQMTKLWIEKQIKEYTALKAHLYTDPTMKTFDDKLEAIWQATLNTLTATLKVINLEMAA